MSDAAQTYILLSDACALLDASNDHAIAAYVGLAMALMEEKYGIAPSDSADQNGGTPLLPRHQENGGSWA